MKITSLIFSDGNIHKVDIFDKDSAVKSKSKSVTCNVNNLITIDHQGETLVVYEKKSKQFKMYTIDTTFKSSFYSEFDLNCIKICENQWIFGGDRSGNVHIYDGSKNNHKKSKETCLKESIISIDISPNKNIFICYENGKVGMLDIKKSENRILDYIDENVTCLAPSPWNYDHLLIGSLGGIVALYDVASKEKIFSSKMHKKKVNCISFSYYNENLALSGGKDNQLVLLTIKTTKPIKIHQTKSPVTSCSMNDGVFYTFCDSDGSMWVYDIRNMRDPVYSYTSEQKIDYLQLLCFEQFSTGRQDEYVMFESKDSVESVTHQNYRYNSDSVESCFSNTNESLDKSYSKSNEVFNISEINSPKNSISSRSENKPHSERELCISKPNINESIPDSMISMEEKSLKIEHITLKTTISEEVKNAFNSFENRFRTDLLLEIVDQLGISERNIINALVLPHNRL